MARIAKENLETIVATKAETKGNRIRVGMSSCGLAAGAEPVYQALVEGARDRGIDVDIKRTGCLGACHLEPLVDVSVEGMPDTLYGHVAPEWVDLILDSHVALKRTVTRLAIPEIAAQIVTCNQSETPSAEPQRQYKIVTRNCGFIDPEDIEDYIGTGGFFGLRRCLTEFSPDDVIDEITKGGLRGRGGAGFPTGLKWKFTRQAQGNEKFVICNGDEGDPGAYMDRSVLEGDPFSVIEGLTIAGYAIGANEGFLYIRAEYPLAVSRIESAIRQAKLAGMLGKNIMGTDFSFNLEVRLGAGAFVCGEETALIASIEGMRGTPKPRPPYPSVKGLWDAPTSINNVETLANIAPIMSKGAAWFRTIGTEKSPGTKVFALTGKVRTPGLVEIPMGTKLRDVVEGLGGGAQVGKTIKAVQTGGPSGGVIPEANLDIPVTYEDLTAFGSMMGSGGMVVMDNDDSIVDITRFYLGFCVEESCGKCAPCRIGGKQLLIILERICNGQGKPEDLDELRRICTTMRSASLCGLGKSAPNPVLSTLRYFNDEYQAAIRAAQTAN